MDNLRLHKGARVCAWRADHPRFHCPVPPVHCSWMNQGEQWFSILQRTRLSSADVTDVEHLAAVVAEWTEQAPPLHGTRASVATVMVRCAGEQAA